MYWEEIENSVSNAERSKQKYEKKMYTLKEYVEIILKKRMDSEDQIEPIIEQLLDCVIVGAGGSRSEFERLNDYYKKLNKNRADYYQQHYRDILGRII